MISPFLTGAVFSPDGKWVAYTLREASSVVIVQPFPATGAKVQIPPNTEDGHHPVWSSDGKELYYTPGAGNRLTAVTVMASQGFAFGPAPPVTRLFRNRAPTFERTFDVARDGKRFSEYRRWSLNPACTSLKPAFMAKAVTPDGHQVRATAEAVVKPV